jgi:manganese transport protein
LELLITAFVGVIAACYLAELFLVRPDWHEVARHAVVPGFAGSESVYLAAGILGATVMPHVIFLHSDLVQSRVGTREPQQLRRIFRFEVADIVIAMGIAGLVNAAMLIMAGKIFHERGLYQVDAIENAYMTLEPLLGSAASTLFAVSLLAAGLSSSAVGTLSGQVIMQGFLNRRIPVWQRRIVTVSPALLVLFWGLRPSSTLILSQVILSFGLPFAIIPLVLFTRQKNIMGALVNSRLTTLAAFGVAALVVILNVFLLYRLI